VQDIEMREKLVTSAGNMPGVEHALLDRQISTDSAMFENPFRAGGELSKDAAQIIDALKTGKLDEVSAEPHETDGKDDAVTDENMHNLKRPLDENNKLDTDKEKRTDANPAPNAKEVEVERGLVINPKHADVEHVMIPEKKKDGCACCIVQ